MSIPVVCKCGQQYRVDEKLAGRRVVCKACKLPIAVPSVKQDLGAVERRDPFVKADTSDVNPDIDHGHVESGRLAPLDPSDTTRASNPGRLYVDTRQYFRCEKILHGALIGTAIIAAVVMIFFDKWKWMSWVPLAICPIMIWKFLKEMQRKMANGCVCPAVVIKDSPHRVAVYTDLSIRGDRPHPAVYVMNAAALVHAVGGPPKVGDRLSAVSYYSGSVDDQAWTSFDPTLVLMVTRSAADIARVDASISDQEWAELETAVAELGDVEPGLYRLNDA